MLVIMPVVVMIVKNLYVKRQEGGDFFEGVRQSSLQIG